jgi:hypothetical protein
VVVAALHVLRFPDHCVLRHRGKRGHTQSTTSLKKCFEHVGATVEYSNRVYSKAMYYLHILVLFLSLVVVPPWVWKASAKLPAVLEVEEPLKETEKVHHTSPHVTS